ncbi:hypothetical protein Tco_0525423 [Tanacetum coccineum]
MVINSPCLIDKKELAIPGQMATGKELSNLLMANSLPKTILPTNTGVVKKNNGEAEIHALIDGKRIVVSKATIRSVLQFGDEGGVECLPTTTIFEEIARMGYEKLSQKLTFYKAFFSPQWKFLIHTILQCLSAKTTAWNEFSSTVASAIICLATNQKFNFSKYILEVEGLPSHHRKYTVPCHTKKFFANMKRVNKDFSGNDTPLFPIMVVQTQTPPITITLTPTTTTSTPTTSTPTPTPHQSTTSVQPSQLQKQRVRKPRRRNTEVTQPSEPEMVADEDVPIKSNDPLSGEDRLKLYELMALCTQLSNRVLDLEITKTAQAKEIDDLKKRVKKLERGKKSRTNKLKRLFKGRRIADIDEDAGVTLDNTTFDTDKDLFGVHDLEGEEVIVDEEPIKTIDEEMTLAQTLMEIKTKAKGIVMEEPSDSAPIISSQQPSQVKAQDKGKAKMIEVEEPKSRKAQMMFDEQLALKLQAEEEEAARLAKQKRIG